MASAADRPNRRAFKVGRCTLERTAQAVAQRRSGIGGATAVNGATARASEGGRRTAQPAYLACAAAHLDS